MKLNKIKSKLTSNQQWKCALSIALIVCHRIQMSTQTENRRTDVVRWTIANSDGCIVLRKHYFHQHGDAHLMHPNRKSLYAVQRTSLATNSIWPQRTHICRVQNIASNESIKSKNAICWKKINANAKPQVISIDPYTIIFVHVSSLFVMGWSHCDAMKMRDKKKMKNKNWSIFSVQLRQFANGTKVRSNDFALLPISILISGYPVLFHEMTRKKRSLKQQNWKCVRFHWKFCFVCGFQAKTKDWSELKASLKRMLPIKFESLD